MSARWRRISERLRAVGGDRRGNFVVTFSLMAPILLLTLGLGMDFLSSLSFKARWDSAADLAALAADEAAAAYAKSAPSGLSSSQVIANAIAAGQAAGVSAFNANAGVSETTGSVTPTIVVTNSSVSKSVVNTQFTATATYTGSTATHFGGLVGIPSFPVDGTATASTSLTTYLNYYILVDISQSMGVGATSTDMSNLYAATKKLGYTDNNEPGCVFGCHLATYGRPLSNEQVAHNNGITLRIDAAKTAIQDIITQAQTLSTANNIQIGLYTMTLDASNNYRPVQVASPTTNYSALTTALQSIDLDSSTTTQGLGDSDMPDSLSYFASNVLGANGTGFSASSPQNIVFIVTDGLVDIPGWCNIDYHCDGALPSTACSTLQQKASVGVIYTTYLPVYVKNDPTQGYDPLYNELVQPYQASIAPALQSCASSTSLYFQADDGPALIAAMSQLFAATASTMRLTQ